METKRIPDFQYWQSLYQAQEINDALDVAECCVYDQINDPNEREHHYDGLKKVRELALAALSARTAMREQASEIAALRGDARLVHALRTDVEKLCEALEHIATGLAEPYMGGGVSKAEAIEIARAAVARIKAGA
jgi:hypothetical protein